MKIAIRGHEARGKEVIQILESLGGINRHHLDGDSLLYYYIDYDDNKTIHCHDDVYVNEYCEKYTLEEFEKEFPFKIGDKVIHKEFNDFFEVISFDPGSFYPDKIKGVCEFNTKSHVLTKWQPKMKEERFVTLTLDKAKEWYKKGGELKEVALQAFTETELNPLPRSWEEFCKNYQIKSGETFVDGYSKFVDNKGNRNPIIDKNVCPSKKSAEAHLAMIQLEQLRDCYNNSSNDTNRIAIINNNGNIEFYVNPPFNCFLTFKNHLLAREFFSNFKEIIEIAKELI